MDIRMKGFHERTLVDDALELLLKHIKPLPTETIWFSDASGRVLGEDITSGYDNPPFDRSAMDGYAVKGENTFGASQTNPIFFTLVGEVTTGIKPDIEIGDFEAVRIMTGGQIPEGADAVVMFEYTSELDGEIEVFKAVTPGKNVSKRGEDVKEGDILLKRGRVIRPHDIGIISAIGRTEIEVFKRPEVAVISTGDELLMPGEELTPGKIYDSNSYTVSSLVLKNGAVPVRVGIIEDDYEKLKSAISDALEYDAVILSGATSVGKKDVIPKVVSELGEILVHGVSMRPGEPTGFGIIKDTPVFMLPGYPVATIFGFETFVRPALQMMQGMEIRSPYPTVNAVLKRKVPSELGRRDYVRVKLIGDVRGGKGLFVEPIRTSGSGIISSLVRADGFVVVPENTEGLEKGTRVDVNLF